MAADRPQGDQDTGGVEADLERTVEAETREWTPPEWVAVARRGATSGFARVTGGFGAVRRRIRFPLWARFLTAALVIVGSVGTAMAATLFLGLSALEPRTLPGAPDLPEPEGGTRTILLLGSDKRPEDKTGEFKGLADTTMLVRLDAEENVVSVLSLPRDLVVDIPGYGRAKLNEAYASGGPARTVETITRLTGVEINDIVDVDFEGFARAVNAIGCVYVDVDRRYFHSNEGSAEQYEEIDLQPGYQALCGFDALDYVRYRHTDHDLVRAARQQDFLREARGKLPLDQILAKRQELASIFAEHTRSTIDTGGEVGDALKLFLEVRDAPIQQIDFEGTLGATAVTADDAEIRRAVDRFLGIDVPRSEAEGSDRSGSAQPKRAPAPDRLVKSDFGRALAAGLARRRQKLPVYYPAVLVEGTEFAQKPRAYKVNGAGDGSPPDSDRAAYRWVLSLPGMGEYYGFMATRWQDPPILLDPTEEREIGDRTYELFYDGGRLRIVAWSTDQGSFWVSNTLGKALSAREMLAVARGMTEAPS